MTSTFVQIYDTAGALVHHKFYADRTPKVLGELKLPFGDKKRKLGGGSFGDVYKIEGRIKTSGQDEGKTVSLAMKVMDINKDTHFSQEIEIHGNRDLRETLVHLYGSFICYEGSDMKLCLLFELAESDLKTLLRMANPKPGIDVLRACSTLVEALAFYHESYRGTTAVHYDLKPENIMIFPVKFQGNAWQESPWKIGDFGMAQIITTTGVEEDPGSIGSHIYLPPERYKDDGSRSDVKPGKPFDVWAMGCIILEVLTWEFSERNRGAVDQFKSEREQMKQKRQCNATKYYGCFWNSQEVVDEKLKQMKTHENSHFRALATLVTSMLDRNPKTRFEMEWIAEWGMPNFQGKWNRGYLGLVGIEESDVEDALRFKKK